MKRMINLMAVVAISSATLLGNTTPASANSGEPPDNSTKILHVDEGTPNLPQEFLTEEEKQQQAVLLSAEEAKKQQLGAAAANNPLASIKALSLHNIYMPSLYGMESTTSNLTWLRYAQPIGRFLLRASLPISTVGPVETQYLVEPRFSQSKTWSGLSDFNLFVTYIATKPTSRFQFGIGPMLTCPTATEKPLGSGKWSAGVALVSYFIHSPQFQIGLLATWQHSFAGDKDRQKTHATTIQPFFMWQMAKGLYFRSTGITVLDFANESYQIPMGLGLGQVFQARKLTFNFFVEPQFTFWHKGKSIPKVQLLMGINTQF